MPYPCPCDCDKKKDKPKCFGCKDKKPCGCGDCKKPCFCDGKFCDDKKLCKSSKKCDDKFWRKKPCDDDTTVRGDLIVKEDAIIKKDLCVHDNAIINKSLKVEDKAYFCDDVKIKDDLIVRGSIFFCDEIIGPCGPIGLQGPQGPQGPRGFQGFQGFQGPQGPRGFQGFQGPQGPDGADGINGIDGVQGPQGFQGDNGDCVTGCVQPSPDLMDGGEVIPPNPFIAHSLCGNSLSIWGISNYTLSDDEAPSALKITLDKNSFNIPSDMIIDPNCSVGNFHVCVCAPAQAVISGCVYITINEVTGINTAISNDMFDLVFDLCDQTFPSNQNGGDNTFSVCFNVNCLIVPHDID